MSQHMDVFEALETCRAIRLLKPDPVPAELIDRLLWAATRSPSPGNSQGWDFVVVDDPGPKAVLGIPDPVKIAAMIPIGWPDTAFGPVNRRPVEDFIHRNRWEGDKRGHAN